MTTKDKENDSEHNGFANNLLLQSVLQATTIYQKQRAGEKNAAMEIDDSTKEQKAKVGQQPWQRTEKGDFKGSGQSLRI